MSPDLVKLLEQGNLSALIIMALMIALVWSVKQWRQAESEKDKLHEARLEDAKEMAVLATEVKNTITTLIRSGVEK